MARTSRTSCPRWCSRCILASPKPREVGRYSYVDVPGVVACLSVCLGLSVSIGPGSLPYASGYPPHQALAATSFAGRWSSGLRYMHRRRGLFKQLQGIESIGGTAAQQCRGQRFIRLRKSVKSVLSAMLDFVICPIFEMRMRM